MSPTSLTIALFIVSFVTGLMSLTLIRDGFEKLAIMSFLVSGPTMTVAILTVLMNPVPAAALIGGGLPLVFVLLILAGYGLGATVYCGIIIPLRWTLNRRSDCDCGKY